MMSSNQFLDLETLSLPGLQEWEKSLLEDVKNGGEEESQCQEDEQFISELPAVVLGDEFPPELNGPRHGLKLLVRLLNRSRRGRFEQRRGNSFSFS